MKQPHASFALLLAVAACGGGSQFTQTAPSAQAAFATSLTRASEEANAGRFSSADKILADYAVHNPASTEAVDALYWRAIYQLDPANNAGSTREATVLLDSYLTSPGATRRAEATTLRRLAVALESKAAPIVVREAPKVVDSPADKAKDDEIARLKDELAKANAELERIKRRLAKP